MTSFPKEGRLYGRLFCFLICRWLRGMKPLGETQRPVLVWDGFKRSVGIKLRCDLGEAIHLSYQHDRLQIGEPYY